ncbi:MAG: DNA gyrase inhibitor YacG [Planctomycetes bacterium]|nr:DNA gyrase inhibitor YacG [Planctomycetota bacterium]MBI3846760.1 DNA gyrase inhibitor YacG [Planctomycetota bacterium]
MSCPTCRKKQTFERIADLPYFPFCSKRCQLIDLGKWANEEYRFSTHLGRDREEEASDEKSEPKSTDEGED